MISGLTLQNATWFSKTRVCVFILEPKHWLALGVFLNISGITDYVSWLSSLESAVFIFGVIAAWIRMWFGAKRSSAAHDQTGSAWNPFVGFLGMSLLCSSIFSSFMNEPTLSLFDHLGWRHFAKFLILVSLCLMAASPKATIRIVLQSMYAGLIVLAISVLVRFFIFAEFHPETGRMELSGRHGDPNFACLFATIGLAFSLSYLSLSVTSYQKCLQTLISVLFLFVAWCTESRAGLLVLAMVLLGSFFLMPWRFPRIHVAIIGSASIAVALVFFGDRLIERYTSIADASNSGRLAGIAGAVDMFLQSPIVGSGFETSAGFVRPYQKVLFQSESVALEIHTTPLQVLGELGLLGLGFYSLLYISLGCLVWIRSREISTSRETCRYFPTMVCGCSLFAIVANMISIPMTYIGTVHGISLIFVYWLYSELDPLTPTPTKEPG